MKKFTEYLVIEASDTVELKRLVEQAINMDGYKLHGGVSSTYIPQQHFSNGEVRCNDGWLFHQGMVRTESGRKHAHDVRANP